MKRPKEQEATLLDLAGDVAAETGIEPELCTISAAWAYDMASHVLADPPLRLSAKYFDALQQQTGEALVVLPRDADDIPLFRTRYVSRELFYKLIAHKYPDARTQIEGSPLEITVHYDRLHEVTQSLLALQRDSQYPYDSAKAEVPNRSENMPPEDILPRGSEQQPSSFGMYAIGWAAGLNQTAYLNFWAKCIRIILNSLIPAISLKTESMKTRLQK